jgi:hypothetical protein
MNHHEDYRPMSPCFLSAKSTVRIRPESQGKDEDHCCDEEGRAGPGHDRVDDSEGSRFRRTWAPRAASRPSKSW